VADQLLHNATLMLEQRIAEIRAAFRPAIGTVLHRYSTAELLFDDGTWDAWPDLPIRLDWGSDNTIAVSWSKFDELWLRTDASLPFSIDGSTVRWIQNSVSRLNPAIGATILSVMLGRGEMTLEGRDVEIWTRLLIETDKGWLEIFNALDGNGYDFHLVKPNGIFVSCL
jgi:hypothetical protein